MSWPSTERGRCGTALTVSWSGRRGGTRAERRLDRRRRLRVRPDPRRSTISNGLGWSRDGASMWYVDSGPGTVDVFRFDADAGTVSDRRTVVRIDPGEGVRTGSRSTPRTTSGWRSGTAARCVAVRRMDASSLGCGCRSRAPRAAASAARHWTLSSSRPRGRVSRVTSCAHSRTRDAVRRPRSECAALRSRPSPGRPAGGSSGAGLSGVFRPRRGAPIADAVSSVDGLNLQSNHRGMPMLEFIDSASARGAVGRHGLRAFGGVWIATN